MLIPLNIISPIKTIALAILEIARLRVKAVVLDPLCIQRQIVTTAL